MGKRWFVFSAFFFVSSFNFSYSLYVGSLNSGSGKEIDFSKWDNEEDPSDFNQELSWKDFEEPKKTLIESPVNVKREESTKRPNVYNFDELFNLTGKDWGSQNETKLFFINTEDYIKIHESEDEDKIETQVYEGNKNIFNLLSPEGLLSQINYKGQSNGLERTKRQAENGKKRCRCRRKNRRNMVRRRRRRRRRNRVGQQQRPARRRRRRRGRRQNQRRGRRRCVCKKKEGEGKSDGEEPEVEEADGEDEGTITEGTDENATEEAETDDEDEDEDEEEEEEEDDDDDDSNVEDNEDENEEEEEGDDENSSNEKGNELKSPEEMPSLGGIPTYIFPYPIMMETPTGVISAGGYPVANIPTRAVPMYKFPSLSTLGALPLEKSISNKED